MSTRTTLTSLQGYDVLAADIREYIAQSNDFAEWWGPPRTSGVPMTHDSIRKFLFYTSRRTIEPQEILDAEKDNEKKQEMLEKARRIILAGELQRRWWNIAREWPRGISSFESTRWIP